MTHGATKMTKQKMQRHDLKQGTPEWLAFRATTFNASDVPAMLGVSPYRTRNKLLHEMHTGIIEEVDAATQQRFDDGHRFEALARPIAEEIIEEELYPVVGSQDFGLPRRLAASFDGLTIGDAICFEHKSINDELRAIFLHGLRIATDMLDGAELPEHHRAQMEQQMMVSGANNCIFVASKFDKKTNELLEKEHCFYESDPAMRERILAGWEQFAIDLAAYVPPEVVAKPVAEAIKALPAVFVQATGMVTASNLEEFKESAQTFIANINTELVTDEDFVNADAMAKFCQQAEDNIDAVEAGIMAQTTSVDEAIKTLRHIKSQLGKKRIELKNKVTSEKVVRKEKMVAEANTAYANHVAGLQSEIAGIKLDLLLKTQDFGGVIRGLKTLASIQNALNSTLSNEGKVKADATAKDVRDKLAWCKTEAAGMSMLFPDLQAIIGMEAEAFKAVIKNRIREHQDAESAKLEAQRIAIQAEEEAKARLKVEAEARTKADLEAAVLVEQKRKEELATHVTQSEPVAAKPVHSGRPAATWPFPVPATAEPKQSSRPTRMQIIEAVAQHFGMTVLAADEMLRSEFDPKVYAGDQKEQVAA